MWIHTSTSYHHFIWTFISSGEFKWRREKLNLQDETNHKRIAWQPPATKIIFLALLSLLVGKSFKKTFFSDLLKRTQKLNIKLQLFIYKTRELVWTWQIELSIGRLSFLFKCGELWILREACLSIKIRHFFPEKKAQGNKKVSFQD